MSDLRFPGPHPLDAVIWRALTASRRVSPRATSGPVVIRRLSRPSLRRSIWSRLRSGRCWPWSAAMTGSRCSRPRRWSLRPRSRWSGETPSTRWSWRMPTLASAQPGAPIVALGVADVPEMLALASVTQPGPFGPRTIELGDYIGIRRRGVLVAMAGGRMRLERVHRDQRGLRGACVSRTRLRSRSRQIAGLIDSSAVRSPVSTCLQLKPCGYRPLPQVGLYPSATDASRGARTRRRRRQRRLVPLSDAEDANPPPDKVKTPLYEAKVDDLQSGDAGRGGANQIADRIAVGRRSPVTYCQHAKLLAWFRPFRFAP